MIESVFTPVGTTSFNRDCIEMRMRLWRELGETGKKKWIAASPTSFAAWRFLSGRGSISDPRPAYDRYILEKHPDRYEDLYDDAAEAVDAAEKFDRSERERELNEERKFIARRKRGRKEWIASASFCGI
jgi:hypothetical protein